MKNPKPSYHFSPISFLITFFYALSIFFGAFLLFQVQPIISKYMLPWFGGASAVWITSMLFFQTFLLLGYLYVFLLSKLKLQMQIALHLLCLCLIGTIVLIPLAHSHLAILPSIASKLPDTVSPIFQVLSILLIATGLPYLLLSTTSVLLQKWFGSTQPGKSPYLFYALSNASSLLAIISYPFLVEPNFSIAKQGSIWSIGFIVYLVFFLIATLLTLFKHTPKKRLIPHPLFITHRHTFVLWLLLPAISSLMLLSITNLLTQSIASVPFLWLLPLGLYLISFILCFSGTKWYWRNFYAYLFLVSGFLAVVFTRTDMPSLLSGIIIYALTLFSVCMLCHGELYHLRPGNEKLDRYYLIIALGSAASGILVGIIAPFFFKGIWEIYIGFYLSFLLAIAVLLAYKNSFLSRKVAFFGNSDKDVYLAAGLCFPVVIIGLTLFTRITSGYQSVSTWRNFYGVLTVSKKTIQNETVTYLKHGNIIHGDQFSGEYKQEPTMYFARQTGIGRVFTALEKEKSALNVGIIGLGAGTLAAYGRKTDAITFYELNPQVVDIAKTQFSYLQDTPAQTKIILGDGRLSLEKELHGKEKPFDLLVIDAFSDDAIPLHLLTKEAFSDYTHRIATNGMLAFHISNNYIDLKPVLVRMAREFRLSYIFIHTKAHDVATETEWAFLSNDTHLFKMPTISQVAAPVDTRYKAIDLWTDQKSNLFEILK